MEPGDSMPHSQGLSNNPYREPNQPNYPHNTYLIKVHSNIVALSSHLWLGLPKGLFPVGLPVKILKALLPSSILVACPAHLKLLDIITLTILAERYKIWSSSLWSLLHSPFSSRVPSVSTRSPDINLWIFAHGAIWTIGLSYMSSPGKYEVLGDPAIKSRGLRSGESVGHKTGQR